MVQWNVLAARVMLGAGGVPVVDGLPYLYPASAKDAIMKALRGVHRKFRRRVRGDDVDFFKRFGSLFFLWWIECALAGHPDLHRQDDGSYAWHEPGGNEEFRRGLGAFVLDTKRVVLETTSKARAERGRAFLEALAGEAVRYRATSFEGVEAAMDRPAPPRREADEIPPEVQAQVVGAYYEQHYRTWVDTPLPALGGRTPRAAAQSKTGRPRVIALLKDMESLSARERLEGRPAYDFGWMWGELGLGRPSP